MADISNAPRRSPIGRLTAHLNNPLYRNGYALILSVASTSGLGFIYWILAARTYSPDVVGVNSAAISAMMFLGGIAQLNLTSSLIRFIPVAGRHTLRFITSIYGVAIAVAVLVSGVFLLGLDRWAGALEFLRSNAGFSIWFIAATVAWCIFVLQDSVLVGLRQATWVPVENTIFAVGKIILMIGFAVWAPQVGLYASWTGALAISVLFTNLIIFRGIMPRVLPELRQKQSSLVIPQVAHYAAADYIGALCWLAATTLLPLIVTSKAGATANAYFFLAWQTAFLMYHISASMGSSLVVEASTDPSQLKTFTYRVVLQTLLLLIPGVIVLLVGAPYILRIFGPDYAVQADDLLRLLALSAIPYMVNTLFVSVSRVRRRMKAIIVTLVTMCTLILVLSELLIDVYGITGVGLACLIGQGLVALVIIVTQVRPLILRGQLQIPQIKDMLSFLPGIAGRKKPLETPEIISVDDGSASTWVEPGYEEVGIPVTAGSFAQPGVAAVTALNRAARKVSPMLGIRRTGQERDDPQEREQGARLFTAILPDLRLSNGLPDPGTWIPQVSDPGTWSIQRHIPTVTDLTIFTVGPTSDQPIAALKVARTMRAAAALQKQAQNLATLQVDTRLGDWRRLLPRVLFSGRRLGQEALVETLLPGLNLSQLIANPGLRQAAIQAAFTTIEELHLATARMISVESQVFQPLGCWPDRSDPQPEAAAVGQEPQRPGARPPRPTPRRGAAGKMHRHLLDPWGLRSRQHPDGPGWLFRSRAHRLGTIPAGWTAWSRSRPADGHCPHGETGPGVRRGGPESCLL